MIASKRRIADFRNFCAEYFIELKNKIYFVSFCETEMAR